nr:hypothetical protein [Frankia sp. Cr1]
MNDTSGPGDPSMIVTIVGENAGHVGPAKVGFECAEGAVSGFPQLHFVAGLPYLSTSTAVPA